MEDLDIAEWQRERPELNFVGRDRKPTKEEVDKMSGFLWGDLLSGIKK